MGSLSSWGVMSRKKSVWSQKWLVKFLHCNLVYRANFTAARGGAAI